MKKNVWNEGWAMGSCLFVISKGEDQWKQWKDATKHGAKDKLKEKGRLV